MGWCAPQLPQATGSKSARAWVQAHTGNPQCKTRSLLSAGGGTEISSPAQHPWCNKVGPSSLVCVPLRGTDEGCDGMVGCEGCVPNAPPLRLAPTK